MHTPNARASSLADGGVAMIHEIQRPAALLLRPLAHRARLQLDAPVRMFSLAAVAAGHCRVPVDAAIATGIHLAMIAPDATDDAVRALTATLRPSRAALTPGEMAWIRQLRVGCSWCENTLPVVWLPFTIVEAASQEQILAGMARAGDPLGLRALLDLECAAMCARVPLDDAFASLKQPGSTPPASA